MDYGIVFEPGGGEWKFSGAGDADLRVIWSRVALRLVGM